MRVHQYCFYVGGLFVAMINRHHRRDGLVRMLVLAPNPIGVQTDDPLCYLRDTESRGGVGEGKW